MFALLTHWRKLLLSCLSLTQLIQPMRWFIHSTSYLQWAMKKTKSILLIVWRQRDNTVFDHFWYNLNWTNVLFFSCEREYPMFYCFQRDIQNGMNSTKGDYLVIDTFQKWVNSQSFWISHFVCTPSGKMTDLVFNLSINLESSYNC